MTRWLVAILLLISASAAQADELRPGYLELRQNSETSWIMLWKAPLRGGLASNGAPRLPSDCTLLDRRTELRDRATVSTAKIRCKSSLIGREVGLTGLDSSFNDALLRVAPLGRPIQTMRLTAGAPMAEIMAVPDRWQVGQTYLWLGIEHILQGYDHLLFVIALVLLITGGWTIAKAVTAFTVAHSITLAGATLGYLGLPQRPVESVIALSIMFLAVEIVKKRPDQPRLSERIPWVVAFLFGLLHGFGFAGALAEVGLPETEVPMALLTFNLGVEIGQLIIVAGALLLLQLLRSIKVTMLRPVQLAAAYAIGIVSAAWFIERTLV